MPAATQYFTDIVHISAHIKTFAARHAEIDLRRPNPIDRVTIDVHEAWLALDHLALTRQFVEWHPATLDRGDHRGHLIEIAAKFFERCAHFAPTQFRNRPLADNVTLSILRAGCDAEQKRSDVFLVFAHQQILDLG